MPLYLHDLTAQELTLQNFIENIQPGDVGTVDWNKEIELFHRTWEDTAISIGKIYLNLEAQSELLAEKGKELLQKSKRIEQRCESLRQYLEQNMKQLKINKVEADVFSVKFKKLPDMLDILPMARIPDMYMRIIPETREPDKRALLQAVKEGEIIDGVNVITNRHKLEIK
jgi:hypothetical protein